MKTIRATFDGITFQISDPIDLKPNTHCLITIEKIENEPLHGPMGYLLTHAGTVIGPPDWSVEHDHYLYGTPKQVKKDE